MSQQEYERVFALLRPALNRVAKDEDFRNKLENNPLDALAEMGLELDADIASELRDVKFSEFWSSHKAKVEGPGVLRDLPPDHVLSEEELGQVVAAGDQTALREQRDISTFAPPYVPVGRVTEIESQPKVRAKIDDVKDKA